MRLFKRYISMFCIALCVVSCSTRPYKMKRAQMLYHMKQSENAKYCYADALAAFKKTGHKEYGDAGQDVVPK